jgi:hypothetical protein
VSALQEDISNVEIRNVHHSWATTWTNAGLILICGLMGALVVGVATSMVLM